MTTTAEVASSCNAELHVYLLGNSYTRNNNLARLTRRALEAGGITETNVDGHCPPGESFSGHLRNLTGEGPKGPHHRLHRSMAVMKKRQWNWIVLQNQSQLPGFIQDIPDQFQRTEDDAKHLFSFVQQNNPDVRLMFLMTWGRCKFDKGNPEIFPDFLAMQAKLTAGYLHYVHVTSTPERPTFVAPCGLVFQTIYNDLKRDDKNPTEPGSLFHLLFAKDGHHPSMAGSYAAAVTIYASLTGKEAKELVWVPEDLDINIAEKLLDAVSRTIQETLSSGLVRYPWQKGGVAMS